MAKTPRGQLMWEEMQASAGATLARDVSAIVAPTLTALQATTKTTTAETAALDTRATAVAAAVTSALARLTAIEVSIAVIKLKLGIP